MKLGKICLALGLALIIDLAPLSPAGSSIIERASQLVNIALNSDTSGVIKFADMKRIFPNGTTGSLSIPPAQVFIVSRIAFTFTADPSYANQSELERFTMDNLFDFNFSTTSGFGGSTLYPGSGILVGKWTSGQEFKVFNSNAEQVPGILSLRIMGFLAPIGAATAPVDLLLLAD